MWGASPSPVLLGTHSFGADPQDLPPRSAVFSVGLSVSPCRLSGSQGLVQDGGEAGGGSRGPGQGRACPRLLPLGSQGWASANRKFQYLGNNP